MTALLLLALTWLQPATTPSRFDLQVQLQALYDEIDQMNLRYISPTDLDLFHEVMYTPDWTFTDHAGHQQGWPQVRAQAVQEVAMLPDSIVEAIHQVVPESDGATVVVIMTTTRAVLDSAGRYGRPGASHTLAESTSFRDRWVHLADTWKIKSREQISAPTVLVDKVDQDG